MEAWSGRVINAREVAKLYKDLSGEWVLLDVLRKGKEGRAEEFEVVAHSENKDDLYEIIMEDEREGDLIFVFADPKKVCDI